MNSLVKCGFIAKSEEIQTRYQYAYSIHIEVATHLLKKAKLKPDCLFDDAKPILQCIHIGGIRLDVSTKTSNYLINQAITCLNDCFCKIFMPDALFLRFKPYGGRTIESVFQ